MSAEIIEFPRRYQPETEFLARTVTDMAKDGPGMQMTTIELCVSAINSFRRRPTSNSGQQLANALWLIFCASALLLGLPEVTGIDQAEA
jgi:hypothetical protein